jgi:hypothetical protein
MLQRELVGNGKTETAASGRLVAGAPDAMERSKHGLQLVGWYPGAAVGYLNSDLVVGTVQVDVDGVAVSMLRRVLQQVRQHPLEGDRIREIHAGRVFAV